MTKSPMKYSYGKVEQTESWGQANDDIVRLIIYTFAPGDVSKA